MSTITQIYEAVKAQLGTAYKVLDSYDAQDEVDPSGTIAVNIAEWEHLDHAGCEDYRFNVAVSGFTLADNDRNRAIIYAMENHVIHHIDLDAISSSVDFCAGAVMGNLTTQSDGDSNEFTLHFDLYVAPATFTDGSSSSSVDGSSNSEIQP